MQALLEVSRLSKSYSGHEVLHAVDFTLEAGERVAVIGENGAGKSTFAKILAGAVAPDSGQIKLDGRAVRFKSPRDALRAGIAFIPQELAYVPELTAGENVMLGRWPSRFGLVRDKAILGQAMREALVHNIDIDVGRKMSSLKLADQQVVEIIKALSRRARVIVLDEPTASLSDVESENLFRILARLSTAGVGILYISHRIDEVHRLSDRVDVFRNGSLVASMSPRNATPKQLIGEMLGQQAEPPIEPGPTVRPVKPAIEILNWDCMEPPGLRGVSMTIGAGEVVGLFGIRGCGSDMVAEALAGRQPAVQGTLVVGGRTTRAFKSPYRSRRFGIGYVPPDRKREGLVLAMPIRDNLAVLMLQALARIGLLRMRSVDNAARRLAKRFDIRSAGMKQAVVELSGGNQQKVLLASRLAPRPSIVVMQEPTRGVDVGARLQIHHFIREICAEGTAVMVVTADVEEAVAISDRLLIMREGRIAGELTGERKTQANALRMAAGSVA